MKSILILALLFIPKFANAQVYVKGVNLNDKKEVRICEILILENAVVNSNIYVSIDYGQERREFNDRLTDASGEKLKFGSIVAAVNHMENNGWSMIDHSITQKGRGWIYRYYFRRKG
jgi:hypothetical protein